MKKFRVFYGLIATFEDNMSPVHFNKIQNKNSSKNNANKSNSSID